MAFLRRIPIAIILVMFCASAEELPALAAPADEAAYTAGLQAVRAGDHAKAVNLFSRAIELNPDDYRYYNDRGIAHKVSGNLVNALQDYTKALTIKPNYPNALNNRGLLLIQQGQYEKAIEDFGKALKYGGFEAKIHTNLGIAHAGKGDHETAVKEFQTAMTFRPMDPRSSLFMAQSLEKLGKTDQAFKMYQVALAVVKDPTTEEFVEKRISELEKEVPQTQPAPPAPAHAQDQMPTRPKPGPAPVYLAKAPSPPAGMVQQPPRPAQVAEKRERAQREIVRARPLAVPPVVKENTRAGAADPLPATLEELDRRSRTRALQRFSANASEIFRQGLQFMEQADAKKALIRFEDTLQLERRNKNALAVAWSMLQAGRAYQAIGDRLKASAHLDGALQIFQRLKSGDEIILTLVDMAAVRKAAGHQDQASKLFSEAMREATSMRNQEVAAVLADMAAGRTPATEKRAATAPGAPKTEGRRMPPAPSPGSETVIAQLELVKRGSTATGSASESVPAPRAEAPKERIQEKPTATAAPLKPEATPPQAVRGPVTWGRDPKPEPAPAPVAAPPITEKRVTDQKTPTQPAQPVRPQEKAVSLPLNVAPSRPVTVETGVGGTPVAVAPSPVRRPLDKMVEPAKKQEPKPAATQDQPAARPEPIIPLPGAPKQRLTRQDRYEAASKRITEDLTELKKYRVAGDETSMIVVLERLSRRYVLRRQYDKALHGLTASLALREKLGLDGPATGLYDDRGALKQKLGNPAGALEDLTKALALAEAESPSSANAAALTSKCRALAQEMGLTPAALDAFRSLWKTRRSRDGRGETDALHAIGKLYDNAQRPAEALNYYERSSASILADKARVYEKLGKQQLAEQSYKEALEAFKRLDYSRYLVMLKESGLDSFTPLRPRR